jgi:hypothetical protein
MRIVPLSPAAHAFNAVAPKFDERFGGWLTVAAQRRAVRMQLVRAFVPGSRVLEIGGGTGEDALWLTAQGRDVLLTDASRSSPGRADRRRSPYRRSVSRNSRTCATERESRRSTVPFRISRRSTASPT